MADRVVPHFHNTPGVAVIEIGAHEFMCEGEVAPFDHPHVYLDMGDATEIICPYCSTLFRLDPTLDPHAARPAECALADRGTAQPRSSDGGADRGILAQRYHRRRGHWRSHHGACLGATW